MIRVSAVFDNYADAERAVNALRQSGIAENDLAFISQNNTTGTMGDGNFATHNAAMDNDADDAAERAGKGLAVGAGVGALFGLAAAAIPGVGPFITAGWLATYLGVTGGAAAAGALVGGTSGALTGLLTDSGYSEEEARYYGSALENGGVFVSVNAQDGMTSPERIAQTLVQYGGKSATAQRV